MKLSKFDDKDIFSEPAINQLYSSPLGTMNPMRPPPAEIRFQMPVAVDGSLTVGLAASAPAPDGGQMHVWAGSAGSVSARSATILTVENGPAADAWIQMLAPESKNTGIAFGNQNDNDNGQITYDPTNDRFIFRMGGTNRMLWYGSHQPSAFH